MQNTSLVIKDGKLNVLVPPLGLSDSPKSYKLLNHSGPSSSHKKAKELKALNKQNKQS